jgi:tryptophan 2,3-dioxygenase
MEGKMADRLNYWDYLKLDSLLEMQSGYADSDEEISEDELHFIVVHQSYELWFKLIIRSLRLARDHLAAPKVPEETIPHVVHHLRRVNTTLALMVQQWRVVETLTPQDFLAFRDKLVPASGFQSFQMRVLEIIMGLDESKRIRYGKEDSLEHIKKHSESSPAGRYAWKKIVEVKEESNVLSVLNDWLYRTPIEGSSPDDPNDETVVTAFLESYLSNLRQLHDRQLTGMIEALGEEHKGRLEEKFTGIIQQARTFLMALDVNEDIQPRTRRCRAAVLFIESYRELPLLAWPRLLLDVIVEMEENMLLFRNGHVRMVERVIGRRVGTGGSSGVGYLEDTLNYRIFGDLWGIRTVLMAREHLPALENASFYGFASPE